ncbi:hypothetical protein ON010_g11232 [Phytophthora cinnamomi]|nr:hypothetical protein ON010_g11232 [Phytophthora cinnamomi]
MKSGLSESCYDAFLFAMKQTSKTGNTFTLKQLDINGVHLYDENWDRMTLAELNQEEALEAYNRAQVAELEKQEGQDGAEGNEEKVLGKGMLFGPLVLVDPAQTTSDSSVVHLHRLLAYDIALDGLTLADEVTTIIQRPSGAHGHYRQDTRAMALVCGLSDGGSVPLSLRSGAAAAQPAPPPYAKSSSQPGAVSRKKYVGLQPPGAGY